MLPEQRNKYANRVHYKPPPQQNNAANYKKLIIVIVISFIFIAGECVGGYISGSISVISDAFHLITDVIGFGVSFIFLYFAKKKPTDKMSFAYHRMELLGALGNLFIIWALALFLVYEATLRIVNKQFVKQPLVMLIVAGAGLPINIVMYFILHAGGEHSHGLMAEKCGEEYPIDDAENNICAEIRCQDIDCLVSNQYQEHCHKKTGESQEIHKHQIKVFVQDGSIKRKLSMDQEKQKNKGLANKNQHKHDGKCNHQSDNKEKNEHKHEHKKGEPCQHQHNKIDNIDSNEIIFKKNQSHDHHEHDHHGHDHHGHDHHQHSHQSLSMKAAVLHALSDVITSVGLLISSLIIFFAGSDMGKPVSQFNSVHLCDPITTYIFSIIVLISTVPIVKNCYNIIMESTPDYIKVDQIKNQFNSVSGVIDIHDLHIWDLRPGKTILIAHLFSQKGQQTKVLKKLTDISRKRRIYHSTFQVEELALKDHEDYILCDHDIH